MAGAVYFKSIPGLKEPSPSIVPITKAESSSSLGAQIPGSLDMTNTQQQHVPPLTNFQGQETQQTSNTTVPPGGQTHPVPLGTQLHTQAQYPLGVQANSPTVSHPTNSFAYPTQRGPQSSIEEMQRNFSSHNLQA
jgi:hypothetical protein